MNYYDEKFTPSDTARLLRAVAALVEKSSADEISALLRGKASLSIAVKESVASRAKIMSDSEIEVLVKRLEGLESREAGEALLMSASLPRRELERIGRILGIPILKTDNMERLTEKIIESSIGSRLNSVAIRGRDIDG